MGSFSLWHWVIVLVVVLVLFGGGGKLGKLMGDAGAGIHAFKKALKGDKKDAEEGEAGESPALKPPKVEDASMIREKDKL